jgi:hypothetical protein
MQRDGLSRWRPGGPVLDSIRMARKPAPWLVRLGVAVASWAVAVSVAQVLLGADIGRAAQQLEERIELQLRGLHIPADPPPERSHEDESLEPWELVSV